MHMPRLRSLIGLSVASLALVAACSSGSGSATTTPAATAPAAAASTATDPAATASTSVADGSSSVAGVSANSASESEIAAALAAAGVPNADRWAREVVEYRPYDASDTTLQKLKDNLAKYNPDPTTLAGILSALVP
jgi:ABC-type phosphate transport system substrate-binding protein